MFKHTTPMANLSGYAKDNLMPEDKRTVYEKDLSGNLVKVTRYSDGSSTVHWGGPCGSTSYDEYGNEC